MLSGVIINCGFPECYLYLDNLFLVSSCNTEQHYTYHHSKLLILSEIYSYVEFSPFNIFGHMF